MKIREATLKDYEELFLLKLESKKEERKWNKELRPLKEAKKYYSEYLKNDLESKWRKVFVAIEKSEIVGLITCKTYRSLYVLGYKRFGYISNIYIKKDFRRKGIAEKLIKKATSWFKQRKAQKISLELYEKNKPAINLYHKLGFKNYSIKMRKKI